MFAAFLLTLMIASPVNAQEGDVLFGECRNYFISGDFSDLVEVGGTIYAATGFGLAVIPSDFSSDEHIPTPYYSRKLVAAGKRIYLGEGNHVTEFKVSGKSARMQATYPVEGRVTALAVNKRFLAVGTDSAKVVIFSQEKELRLLGVIEVPQTVKDLSLYGKFVYAACGRGGVAIIGIEENPSLVRTLEVSGAQALEVAENTLFVATTSSEIYGFSLSDPSFPQEKIKFSSSSPVISLVYYDNYLYAAQGYQGYSLFNLRGERLEIAELAREGYVARILPTGKGVFLALGEHGLVRLNGKSPQEFRVVGRLTQNSPSVHTAQSGAFWAVARGRDGVNIIRLFEGETSVSFGHVDPVPSKAAGVLLSGTYLYVADADRGACIFDLKTFPIAERKFDLNQPGTPQRFALTDDFIFLAAGDFGARVLWICSCGPLKERSALEKGIRAVDVAVKDSIVYVADPDSGLRVLVVRDKGRAIHHYSASQAVGLVEPVSDKGRAIHHHSIYPGTISPIALLREGDVLYVADSIGAVIALDISDSSQPSQLSFSYIGAQPYGLGITGSTLYVACGEQGILPIDVSDPKFPLIGEFIDTPGKALAVAPSEEYVGVADYTSWILIPRN